VYAGERHLATWAGNAVYYNHADGLGTERARSNASGARCETIMSLPFGDGQTTSGTCGDPSPNHFTGKERDAESGLDNFGARCNASSLGRFMTPDPLLNSGRPWNPQTWNRYAYARNNPLSIVDPTGLYDLNNTCASDDKKCNKQFQQHANDLKKGLANLQKKVDNMKDGPEKQRLEASLKVLGTEGDNNNVNVKFGALPGTAAGDTKTVYDDKTGGLSFNVTFDPSKISGGTNYWGIDAAHEGTHVSDISDPRYANSATTLSDFSLEYRGYQTSAWAAQAFGVSPLAYDGGRNVIWNSGWAAADRQTLMDHGITNHVTSIPGHPETTPHNPWPN
jgi:RHS repeat-associated protein